MSTKLAETRALTLSERERIVARAFYRQFDDYGSGVEYFIRGIYEDHLVAFADHEQVYYRAGYQLEAGVPSFEEQDAWQQVEHEWVAVARGAEEAHKRELLTDDAPTPETPSGDSLPAEAEVRSTTEIDYRVSYRESSDQRTSTFLIMTGEIARDGAIVDPSGVDTATYMRNPVVYWDHGRDPRRGRIPIGRTISVVPHSAGGRSGLLATMEWYDDEFSQDIRRAVQRGFLNMASFSWLGAPSTTRSVDGMQVPVFERSEMVEWSVVGVGSDRNATVMQRGFDPDAFRAEIITEIRTLLGGNNTTGTHGATAPEAPAGTESEATADPSAPAVPDVAAPVLQAEPVQRQLGEEDYARMAAGIAPTLLKSMRGELRTLVRQALGKS